MNGPKGAGTGSQLGDRTITYDFVKVNLLSAVFGFVLALFGVQLAFADDNSTVKVAVGSLESFNGNPFSSSSIGPLVIWSAIFDPLTLVTAEGELIPWLAESWEQTSPLTWTVKLREGVTFSNGEPLTSEAITASIVYLTSETGRGEPVARDLDIITSARSLDVFTAELTTSVADPLLPRKLSLLRMVPPDEWRRLGPDLFGRTPVGTGPFFVTESAVQRKVLRRFTDSWRSANIESLEFNGIADSSARRFALQTGQVDIAFGAVSPTEFEDLLNAGVSIYTDRIPAIVSMIFNTVRDENLRDERVRRAINMAVDRQAIVDILLDGRTTVAAQPAVRGMFGYDETIEPLPFDPPKALQLLEEAGLSDGFSMLLEMPSSTVLYVDVFQKVAADLANIGINVRIQQLPQALFLDKLQTGDWDGSLFAYPFFSPVFDAIYPMRLHSCHWHAPWYCDREQARLIEEALAEADEKNRAQLTRNVMRRAHESAQALFLYDSVAFVGISDRAQGFRSDYSFVRYEDIVLTEQ